MGIYMPNTKTDNKVPLELVQDLLSNNDDTYSSDFGSEQSTTTEDK
jgi:hypothetical protein